MALVLPSGIKYGKGSEIRLWSTMCTKEGGEEGERLEVGVRNEGGASHQGSLRSQLQFCRGNKSSSDRERHVQKPRASKR